MSFRIIVFAITIRLAEAASSGYALSLGQGWGHPDHRLVKVVAFNDGVRLRRAGADTNLLPCFQDWLEEPEFCGDGSGRKDQESPAGRSSRGRDGITAGLMHDGPVLVDADVNRTELAMPPSITLEMTERFTLYMAKTVISGRADEVVHLAKTNLRR